LRRRLRHPINLSGTVSLHNVNWKADYLANHVEMRRPRCGGYERGERGHPVGPGGLLLRPGEGNGHGVFAGEREPAQTCKPRFTVQFAHWTRRLAAADPGAHEKGTLLPELIARLKPSSAPVWPPLEGTVEADWLLLGR